MHLNKYEIVGMFLSVGVMALALVAVRSETSPTADLAALDGATQSAVVVATDDGSEGLKNALVDAATTDGELINLVIDDVRVGDGATVKEGDTVRVHYIGTTRDGVQFDSSYARGEPFIFTVGAGKVIQGWEKGLVGMKVGGQRILVIPPDMAYGNRQVGPIPPNSPLVFAIELLEIK
jgi:FKBP-type peptidyl-prolyl cis-trans isomerase